MGFDFSFGLGVDLDPKYGYYSVKLVHYYYSNTLVNGTYPRLKEKITIPVQKCGTNLLRYDDTDEIIKYGINNYMCFGSSNYSLEGDFYSTEFKYLEVKLIKC